MKKVTIKQLVPHIPKQKFDTHIDPMQLALFRENKLTPQEYEEVSKHLISCEQCNDIFLLAVEMESMEDVKESEEKPVPVNNPDYKGKLKHFLPFAASIVIFLGVPQGNKYLNPDPSFKGNFVERNILVESMEFWKKVYTNLLKLKENR